MPLIHVTAQQGALNIDLQHTLMSRLSDAVLTSEGADIKDEGALSLVWATYSVQAPDTSYVAGKPHNKAPLIISVTTPQGALNASSRKSLVKNIGVIIDELIGKYDGRLNHWVMLSEIDEGSWAGAGQIFNLTGIQQAMNIKAA